MSVAKAASTAAPKASSPSRPKTVTSMGISSVKPGTGGTSSGCLITETRRWFRSKTIRPSGRPLMRAFCRLSTSAIARVRFVIDSSSELTEKASSANSSSPFQSRRGQSASPQCSRAFRTQSVMRERGLSSIRLWNQKTGSTSTMPTREMKSVRRPIATPAAFEKVFGSDTAIIEIGLPAMSRIV